MPVPNIGYGGTTLFGNAKNSSQSDTFQIYGGNNAIYTYGGNETITGGTLTPYGADNATYVDLGDSTGVTDVITLDGGNNTITGNESGYDSNLGRTFNYSYLKKSSLTVTVSGTIGGNYVASDTYLGNATVKLGGQSNKIYLDGNYSTNTITAGSGFDLVDTGYYGANATATGYATSVTLAASGNIVYGDAGNYTVTGGVNNNYVWLGNGNNSISLSGVGNSVKVNDGNNTISVGGGNAQIFLEDLSAAAVPASDQVTIAGTGDFVDDPTYGTANIGVSGGTGGNDVILGNGADAVNLGGGQNYVYLGNGNDNVSLLSATGGNSVAAGNGNDIVTVSGNGNAVQVGSGTDSVTLGGSSNSVVLNSASVVNTDTLTLGAGSGNAVQLGAGNVVVTGSGSNNTIVGSDVAAATVSINLGKGAGNGISLGNGTDSVTDNGDNVSVTAGNGNDTVVANGDYVSVTLGSGNNYISAVGTGDNITVNGTITSTDTIIAGTDSKGSYSTISLSNATGSVTLGVGDTLNLSNTQVGSMINMFGTSDMVFLTNNASGTLTFGAPEGTDTVAVYGNSNGSYKGLVTLDNFGLDTGTLDLQGLVGANGESLTTMATFFDNLSSTSVNHQTQDVLSLKGGGSIYFTLPVDGGFNSTDIVFSGGTATSA